MVTRCLWSQLTWISDATSGLWSWWILSYSIGERIPRAVWRRCRLWKISRYSKMALANSIRVRHRCRSRSSTCIRAQYDSITALEKTKAIVTDGWDISGSQIVNSRGLRLIWTTRRISHSRGPAPTQKAPPTPDTPPEQPQTSRRSSFPPRHRHREKRQWLSALAAGTVLAVVVAAVTVGGTDTESPDVRAAVDTLTERGVLDGTDCRQRGCWDHPLQRWTMAVWISRAIGLTPDPNAHAASRFADVNPNLWWAPHVELLANTTIANGCATRPDRYCPHNAVTRGQMATTLTRAFGLPPAPTSRFTDTDGNVHSAAIDALTASGIDGGCDTQPPRFCPDRVITRGQAAALLHQVILHHQQPGESWVSYDIPNIALKDITSREPVNLRTLVDGTKPLLLWFWSPW